MNLRLNIRKVSNKGCRKKRNSEDRLTFKRELIKSSSQTVKWQSIVEHVRDCNLLAISINNQTSAKETKCNLSELIENNVRGLQVN